MSFEQIALYSTFGALIGWYIFFISDSICSFIKKAIKKSRERNEKSLK